MRGKRQQRIPRQRPGVLTVKWATVPVSKVGGMNALDPELEGDLVYASGTGCSRADSRLLDNVLAGPRGWDYEKRRSYPPLLEELVARGYDLSTLRFTIRKKGAP